MSQYLSPVFTYIAGWSKTELLDAIKSNPYRMARLVGFPEKTAKARLHDMIMEECRIRRFMPCDAQLMKLTNEFYDNIACQQKLDMSA